MDKYYSVSREWLEANLKEPKVIEELKNQEIVFEILNGDLYNQFSCICKFNGIQKFESEDDVKHAFGKFLEEFGYIQEELNDSVYNRIDKNMENFIKEYTSK